MIQLSQENYKSVKPVILACNKVDNPEMQMNVYEFYALGLGDPVVLSGAHGIGLGDLLDIVMENFQKRIYLHMKVLLHFVSLDVQMLENQV